MRQDDLYASFMLDHAAGNLPAALSLTADIHALLNADGARTHAIWEAVGGVFMEDDGFDPNVEITSHLSTGFRKPSVSAKDILQIDLEQLPWRRALGNSYTSRTPLMNARFLKLEPGKQVPVHGHKHLEATVVLSGAFEDDDGLYQRGDISLTEPGARHAPKLIGNEPCVCFVGKDGSWVSGVVGLITGH